MSSNETVFISTGDVLISNSRAVFGQQTFALANITSVGYEVETLAANDNGRGCLLGCGLVLLLAYGLGIILIIIALTINSTPKKIFHKVMLHTAGGELTAYKSEDRMLVDQIIQAINNAIIARG